MLKSNITILLFCVLIPCCALAQRQRKREMIKVEKVLSDKESDNHPPMNSPIVKKLKDIDYAEISPEHILIPNIATELDEDGNVPTTDACFSYVINVIDKDVIGANSLGEELNSPLKRKHYLESGEGKAEYGRLLNERDEILSHDYFIESDFESQFNLDSHRFEFEIYNPNDYNLKIQSSDSSFDNYTQHFKTQILPEDLAYKIETSKVKSFLIVGLKDKVNREYSERIVLIPKRIYLADTKDGSILYEYNFTENAPQKSDTTTQESAKDEKIFEVVEQMPSYPGGGSAFMKDLYTNFVHYTEGYDDDAQGRIIAEFIVEKDGSIGEVKITRSLTPELDQAAVSAIKRLKQFEPAKQNGKCVRSRYTCPIVFRRQ